MPDPRPALLDPEASTAEILADHELDGAAFERRFLLSVDDFRALRGRRRFDMPLPPWLLRSHLRRYWGRDPSSLSEEVDGDRISWATVSPAGPLRVDAHLGVDRVAVEAHGGDASCRDHPWLAVLAHDLVLRCLGLHLDPRPFEALCEPRLLDGRRGLTLPQTASVFDGALWVVAGQQVSLAAAFSIRRRLTEAFGTSVAGLRCSPAAATLNAADPEALHLCGLTRRKVEYLQGLAALAEKGLNPWGLDRHDDLESWRRLDLQAAQKMLLGIRGFGAWSAGYLLMRALGYADCVPYGDVALQKALQLYFATETRPDRDGTERLMAPFRPYRSLATFHFWAWSAEHKSSTS